MKRFIFLAAVIAAAAVFAFSGYASAELKVGAGKADITPKPGCYLGGYYYLSERAKGVHDPLHVRAIVFDDGKTKIGFAAFDLVMMPGEMSEEIKRRVNEEFGIPKENINLSVEHTHTGPEGFYGEYGRYPKEFVPEMKKDIEDKAVDAFRQSMASLAPATVGYEQFTLAGYGGNRHDPEGPVDKTAILVVVKNKDGKPVSGFLNFANHPTMSPTQGLLVSGDWTGLFQSKMEEKMGPGSVFLYLQGACGNLGTPGGKGEGFEPIDDASSRFVKDIFPRLAPMKTSGDITVAAARKDYTFSIRTKKSVSDFNKAMPAKIEEIEKSNLPAERKERRVKWLKERYGIESFMQMLFPTMRRVKGGKTKTTAQAFRIGDLLMMAFPGEPMTEYSIEIRQRLAPRMVAVLGYSNDHLGYLANKKVYEEGGYEGGMGLIYPDDMDKMVNDLELEVTDMFAKK